MQREPARPVAPPTLAMSNATSPAPAEEELVKQRKLVKEASDTVERVSGVLALIDEVAQAKAKEEEEEQNQSEGRKRKRADEKPGPGPPLQLGPPSEHGGTADVATALGVKANTATRSNGSDDDDDDDDEDQPKQDRAPKKDMLKVFGSHEKVLTHYMMLRAGFEVSPVVYEFTDKHKPSVEAMSIRPKNLTAKGVKSFRARLGKHLHAIGFYQNGVDDLAQAGVSEDTCVEAERTEKGTVYLADHDNYHWLRFGAPLDPYTLRPPNHRAASDSDQFADPFADPFADS